MATLAEKFKQYGGVQADYTNPDDFDRNFGYYTCGYTDALEEAAKVAERAAEVCMDTARLYEMAGNERQVEVWAAKAGGCDAIADAIRALPNRSTKGDQ